MLDRSDRAAADAARWQGLFAACVDAIRNARNAADPYGHGTHVAGIAAARGGDGSSSTTDAGGVAPGADLYDVRVIDERGVGTMADMLAGMDWAIQRARRFGQLRVINLSVGADSTESFIVDPLAVAARSASAAGLVVVAAAGNHGRNAAGQPVLGAIVSPGHDPSVITVGAANSSGSGSRADDVLAGFSSRGPTRGAWHFANGKPWVDNLVKPDLVAPGVRPGRPAGHRC
ncbi:MAG: S8 family serine peptidase [Rubrivivax sp.]